MICTESADTLPGSLPASATAPLATRSVLVLRPFLRAAADLGDDGDAVLASFGISRELIDRDEARLESTLVGNIAARLAEGHPGIPFGLVAARSIRLGAFGTFEHLLSAASTLRDAALLATQFYPLLDETSELLFEEHDATASFVLSSRTDPLRLPILAEFVMASILRVIQEITGREIPGTEVRFIHKSTNAPRAYEKHFHAPVTFGAARHEIVFPRAVFSLPLPRASSAVEAALARCASEQLARSAAPPSFLDRVRHTVTQALGAGTPSVDDVARQLALSGRTLQRKLRAHGTTYDALLEQTRRDLAVHLVSRADTPILEVARRAGFADSGAFARAFRRWTASSPTSFRRAAQEEVRRPRA